MNSNTSGDNKRERLFDTYSTNLELLKQSGYFPFEAKINSGYICPLCFKIFDKEALQEKYDDRLTLEDVPPQALGGNVKLLTCKICNNTQGSSLDKHLKEQLVTRDFLSGTPNVKRRARFTVNEKWNIGGTIHFTKEEGFRLIPIKGNSHEKHFKKLFKEGGIDISKIDFKVSGEYESRRADVAKLRAAYLWLVSEFGYASLYNPHMHTVRKQILNPYQQELNAFTISDVDFPSEGVCIITEPDELKSYAVAFNLKTDKKNRKFVVLLPGPTEPDLSVYDEIERLDKAGKRISFSLTKLDLKGVLTDEERVFDYYSGCVN